MPRAGYYWPNPMKDILDFVKKPSKKCHRYSNLYHVPAEALYFVTSPWSVYQWGMDILGPFPFAVGHLKFLIIRVDYFMN